MQRRGSRGSPASRREFGEPVLRRRDEASIEIEAERRHGVHHAFQEREEEEYYYVHSEGPERPHSEGSDTATMHFTTDDRLEQEEERLREHQEHYSEGHRLHRSADFDEQRSRRHELSYEGARQNRFERNDDAEERVAQRKYQKKVDGRSFQRDRGDDMPIDYSPQDFRQSFAAIEAASRDNVTVRQHGDTTIMTEHRDPYSFYWQLDQVRRAEEEPPRRPPPVDYVIDEEEEEHYESPPPRQDPVLSPDSGLAVESQYSRPQKIEEPPAKQLPAGWERHEDPSGYSYYWHVDTGTIQREPPAKVVAPPAMSPPPPPRTRTPSPTRSFTSRFTQADPEPRQVAPAQPVITEHAFKQTTTKRRVENRDESEENDAGFDDDDRKPVRFAVRSLGWTEIAEEELTAERSSRAVNRAIVDLAGGLTMDNVSKWGDGRELIMELDDQDLTLLDPDTMNVVHSEKIQQIRVWGVGRDNGRLVLGGYAC
uniref:WW domain-containing protein n=1 Tax=Steinernema glaseri TaxID=37863 RepID=A0A1I7Z1R3_9BILA